MLPWNATREEDQKPKRLEGKVCTNPRQRALLPGEQGPVVAGVDGARRNLGLLVGGLPARP